MFRIAGWLLTPLVVISAAAIGASIGLVLAPRFAPQSGLIVTVVFAFFSSIAGLVLWVRLLRHSPRLRHTFAVTAEGLPESEIVEHIAHPDATPAEPDE